MPTTTVPPKTVSPTTISGADRYLVREIDKHEFPEPIGRLLRFILCLTRRHGDPPRWVALIPRQSFMVLLCAVSKGRASQGLGWLERQRVIERQTTEVAVQGRVQHWTCYAVNEPCQWLVPVRVEASQLVAEAEAWLAALTLDQPEMLPPPATLRELLREDFVERHYGTSRVEPGAVGISVPAAASSPGGNQVESRPRVGRLWAAVEKTLSAECVSGPNGPVPPGGTLPSKVPSGGTSAVPSGGTRARVDRIIESNCTAVHSIEYSNRVAQVRNESAQTVARLDVAARLFRLIGEREREGLCRKRWAAAIEQIPAELDELIGHVEMLEREGRLESPPVRWLNTAVGKALAIRPG